MEVEEMKNKYFEIIINQEEGVGLITFKNAFYKQGYLWRLDVLQDLMKGMEEEYELAAEGYNKLLKAAQGPGAEIIDFKKARNNVGRRAKDNSSA